MSALALRIIATVCMLLDHIGLFFGIFPFRLIGRIAFPLYAYLLVNGFYHTKNRTKYALRLLIFALISQIPFSLMLYYYLPIGLTDTIALMFRHPILLSKCNIFVTLLLGLLVIWSGEKLRECRVTRWFCLAPAMIAVVLCHYGYLQCDYGTVGVLLIVSFWIFHGKKLWMTLGLLVSFYFPQLVQYAYQILKGLPLTQLHSGHLIPLCTLPSLALIFAYNGKPGRLPKNRSARKAVQLSFYAFYPTHMLVLWLIYHYHRFASF